MSTYTDNTVRGWAEGGCSPPIYYLDMVPGIWTQIQSQRAGHWEARCAGDGLILDARFIADGYGATDEDREHHSNQCECGVFVPMTDADRGRVDTIKDEIVDAFRHGYVRRVLREPTSAPRHEVLETLFASDKDRGRFARGSHPKTKERYHPPEVQRAAEVIASTLADLEHTDWLEAETWGKEGRWLDLDVWHDYCIALCTLMGDATGADPRHLFRAVTFVPNRRRIDKFLAKVGRKEAKKRARVASRAWDNSSAPHLPPGLG